MLSAINVTNIEATAKGLLVALDAKKAFDSVEHEYIEQCLIKFGCLDFVPIFRTLYSDLKTDIIINGKVVPGFRIKKGVKQGDALSCILFIMCMEPLIRNIERNQAIEPIVSNTLMCNVPKTFAYADDVNCLMKDSEASLQELFKEYERLTKKSGLELNANKTELMRLGSEDKRTYQVQYKERNHIIDSMDEIKINGILFQRDPAATIERNVEAVILRMDKQFRSWSRRSLSTLGKILIAKTFGLSQVIYLLQTLTLSNVHIKRINAVLYKFIWNRHYQASKAPERVRREIVNKKVNYGGYGMIDLKALGDSLALKALGRIRTTEHPFLKILNEKLNLDPYFFPTVTVNLDLILVSGVQLLKEDRNKLWADASLNQDRRFLAAVRETKIRDIVHPRGLNSIPFFRIHSRGVRKVGDLLNADIDSLVRHIDAEKIHKIRIASRVNIAPPDRIFSETYYDGKMHKWLNKMSAKEIRTLRGSDTPILNFKLGLNLGPDEALNWGRRLSKLTSTSHKNTILKIVHGDIYTNDKLFRYGMSDTNICPRCDLVEDLNHKFIECAYVRKIWEAAKPWLAKLGTDITANEHRIATAATQDSTIESLTLTAEVLKIICYLKPDQSYLVHPKQVIHRALINLKMKEGNIKIKNRFITLLNETNRD